MEQSQRGLGSLFSIVVFILCFSFPLRAEVELRGRVVDSARSPIVGAQVQLFDMGKQSPFDFQSTDGKGAFCFQVKRVRPVRLEIRALGYEEFVREVDFAGMAVGEVVNLGDVLLQTHFQEISEVHVETMRAVVRRGDTVAYRVDAFAKGGEKSIEDVIKNLPGMKVEEDGQIRYLGRPIERVLVGGADMFGSNYQILTKNLDPSAVHEVQVLEHFEENRLMRKHRKSERVAMNLQLKSGRGALLGTLRAAYGYRHVHDAQGSLIGVFNKFQLNTFVNSNQVGESPAGGSAVWASPQGLTGIEGGDIANVGGRGGGRRLRSIVGMQGAGAPLADVRSRQNMSHMLSGGFVYTPSAKFQIKLSAVGQWQRDRFHSEMQSDWHLDKQKVQRRERSSSTWRTYLTGVRLTLEGQAGEMADLRYDGGYSLMGKRSESRGEHAVHRVLEESSDALWQRMDHTLLYTQSLDSAGLLRGGVEWQSQWLDPRYFAQTFGASPLGFTSRDGIKTHYQESLHFGRSVWIYFAPMYKGLTGDVRLGGAYTANMLSMRDFLSGDATYAKDDYDLYTGGNVSYGLGALKLSALLLGHVSWMSLVGADGNALASRRVFFPESQLALQLLRNVHRFVFSYGYNTSHSSLLGVLPRPILVNFRTVYRGSPKFQVHFGHSVLALYSYGLHSMRITAEASVQYSYNPNPGENRSVVMQEQTMLYVMLGRKRDALSANAVGNIFFPYIMTNLKLSIDASQSHYTQYLNDVSFGVRSRNLFANINSRTTFRSFLDVQLGASWSTLCVEARGERALQHDMSQYVEVQVTSEPVRFSISADRLEIGVNREHTNAIYFLDASLEWEAIKERLTLYIEGHNLLNYSVYSNLRESGFEVVRMRYEIPSVRVLGGLRWQF